MMAYRCLNCSAEIHGSGADKCPNCEEDPWEEPTRFFSKEEVEARKKWLQSLKTHEAS
jgi:hypothetical protein